MVEALTAVTVTSVAGGALLASLGTAVRSSTEALHAAVARGLAQQMMDEIAAARFPSDDAPSSPDAQRADFGNLDDYDGWAERPPVDRRGRVLGTEGSLAGGTEVPRPPGMQPDPMFLARFAREVRIERVEPDGAGGWRTVTGPADHRRATVRVIHADNGSRERTLAEFSRIFSYVPVAP